MIGSETDKIKEIFTVKNSALVIYAVLLDPISVLGRIYLLFGRTCIGT